MNTTQLAILGRFSGDRVKAMNYCELMAKQNEKLWDEYMTHKQAIEWETKNANSVSDETQSAYAIV